MPSHMLSDLGPSSLDALSRELERSVSRCQPAGPSLLCCAITAGSTFRSRVRPSDCGGAGILKSAERRSRVGASLPRTVSRQSFAASLAALRPVPASGLLPCAGSVAARACDWICTAASAVLRAAVVAPRQYLTQSVCLVRPVSRQCDCQSTSPSGDRGDCASAAADGVRFRSGGHTRLCFLTRLVLLSLRRRLPFPRRHRSLRTCRWRWH